MPFFTFLRAIREPFLIAFTTASSEAALPKALEVMERFGCPKNIVGLVLPTGYSFNLDGTTLYLSLASVFVAQLFGVPMNFGQQMIMMLTLMITSKGVAGVPRAALVVLTATLAQFKLPLEGAAILLAIDQILDMGRTSVNVMGNCIATAVVARWEGVFDDEKMKAFAVNSQLATQNSQRRSQPRSSVVSCQSSVVSCAVLLIQAPGVRLFHRPHDGQPDEAVQEHVVRRRERLFHRIDEPRRDHRRRAAGQSERHAVGHAHGRDTRSQREDLDDHRALKAERHAQRHREHHLPPEEMPKRPSHHQLVRGKDQRHRGDRQRHHQAAPAGLVRQPAAERLREQHHEQHQRVDQQEVVGANRTGRLGRGFPPLDRKRERQVVRGIRHGDDAERLHEWDASRRGATASSGGRACIAFRPASVS